MKAAIFDPYLNTVGGGEVYTCSVAELLLKKDFSVDIFWLDEEIKIKIKKYLDINVDKSQINKKGYEIYSKHGNYLEKLKYSKSYDLFFYLSDGSIPWLFAKRNILHFQVPFTKVNGKSISNKLKLKNIHHIICNSKFTKNFIDKEFGVDSKIIYPPINIKVQKIEKENIILSVGRFTDALHNKRQDILVEAFTKLCKNGLKDWKLVLIGSSREGKHIIKKLKQEAKGYPIEIKTDISHHGLEEEYAKAKFFWHAAGYGIDEEKNPELVEHFGIVTAEAMAAGCVPVVIKKGGQTEIIQNKNNGLLWDTTEQLKQATLELISNKNIFEQLLKNAKRTSQQFSKQQFFSNFSELIKI